VIDETEGLEQSPWTEPAFGGAYDIDELSPDEEAYVSRSSRVAVEDGVAREASQLLRHSLLLQDFAGDQTWMLRAAVLTLFQVIERISQEVSRRAPGPSSAEQQGTVIAHLRRSLAKNRGIAHDAKTIRRAAAELNRIDGATADQQIVRAGRILGVEGTTIDVARSLLRFRSTKLAHPGKAVRPSELRTWLSPERGRGAAVRFWQAYGAWLQAGRPVSETTDRG